VNGRINFKHNWLFHEHRSAQSHTDTRDRKGKKRSQALAFILFFFFFAGFIFSCNDNKSKKAAEIISAEDVKKGKHLASVYCQSCHSLPDPSWADSKTWENGILPIMGPRLGIFQFNGKYYPASRNDLNLDRGFYPSKPVVTDEQWQQILNYYTSAAPDTITTKQNRKYDIKDSLSVFTAIKPSFHYFTPATCYVKIDSTSVKFPLIIADAVKKKIYRFDKNLAIVDSFGTLGPVVDIQMSGLDWIATDIGVLNPNNGKYGNAQRIRKNNRWTSIKDSGNILFRDLQRPVHIDSADLNNDGLEDYVVCEFGFLTGAFSWMENKGDGKFERHILRPLPGAIKVYIQDFNHDKLPDLLVLFSQGEEGVFLYTNEGNGKFSEKQLLRFPPIYGSSYFELDDFNNDGYPDILYTCGDNADYSPVLKPYHGVYIFLNDGNNGFAQKYFFPINGCYKAVAKDFDNDGDLDIAAISFFADYQHQPEEGFVYLENRGNYDFMPYSLPVTRSGRWLTMDAGDFDHDGKIDLILGNFALGPSIIQPATDWKNSPPFLILKNRGVNK